MNNEQLREKWHQKFGGRTIEFNDIKFFDDSNEFWLNEINSLLSSLEKEIEDKLGENKRTPPQRGFTNNTESYRKILAHYKGYNKGVADTLSLIQTYKSHEA